VGYEPPPLASLLIGAVQEADLVSPGFEQSRAISNRSTLDFTLHCGKQRIVLPGDASWKRLCSSSVPPDDDDEWQGRMQRGAGGLTPPEWLHDSPQLTGGAILSAENSGKPLGARTPLGELTALPRPRSWWGGGLLPPPKNPTPLSRPSALRSCPNEKSWARPCPWLRPSSGTGPMHISDGIKLNLRFSAHTRCLGKTVIPIRANLI